MRLLILFVCALTAAAYKNDPDKDYQKSGSDYCSVMNGIVHECDGTSRPLSDEERRLLEEDAQRRAEEWDERRKEFGRRFDEKTRNAGDKLRRAGFKLNKRLNDVIMFNNNVGGNGKKSQDNDDGNKIHGEVIPGDLNVDSSRKTRGKRPLKSNSPSDTKEVSADEPLRKTGVRGKKASVRRPLDKKIMGKRPLARKPLKNSQVQEETFDPKTGQEPLRDDRKTTRGKGRGKKQVGKRPPSKKQPKSIDQDERDDVDDEEINAGKKPQDIKTGGKRVPYSPCRTCKSGSILQIKNGDDV